MEGCQTIYSVDFNQMPNLYSFINTIGLHLVCMDGPLCGPYINFKTKSDRQRQNSTVGMILSFRLQGGGFELTTLESETPDHFTLWYLITTFCFDFIKILWGPHRGAYERTAVGPHINFQTESDR